MVTKGRRGSYHVICANVIILLARATSLTPALPQRWVVRTRGLERRQVTPVRVAAPALMAMQPRSNVRGHATTRRWAVAGGRPLSAQARTGLRGPAKDVA